MDDEQQGLTRRQMIKRGAALGGALVWAVPVVQTIGMTPALAQDPSGPPGDGGDCDTLYAIKMSPRGCEDIAGQTTGKGMGHCLNVPLEVKSGGCSKYAGAWPLTNGSWQITFTCEVDIRGYAIKSGVKTAEPRTEGGKPDKDDMCVETSWEQSDDYKTVTFKAPEQDISHIEIIFCCMSGGE